MTARPASVSDVGSGQRPFLRDAFAKELRVDVRQPEDNRRDQDAQCNALGIGRTGLRETTITAAARTKRFATTSARSITPWLQEFGNRMPVPV